MSNSKANLELTEDTRVAPAPHVCLMCRGTGVLSGGYFPSVCCGSCSGSGLVRSSVVEDIKAKLRAEFPFTFKGLAPWVFPFKTLEDAQAWVHAHHAPAKFGEFQLNAEKRTQVVTDAAGLYIGTIEDRTC